MGGIITHMQDVSRVLVSYGYRADIVCDQCVAAPDSNVPVIRIPEFVPRGVWQKMHRPQRKVQHLFEHLPDVPQIDMHWPREAHYAHAVLEQYGPDKMVYIMPTVYPRMFDYGTRWGWKNRLRSFVFRPQIAQIEAEVVAHCHVAVDSQARKDEVIEFYHANPDRVHVVPLGIDVERFSNTVIKKNDIPTGLTVARLGPEKGVHSLLEALAQVRGKNWQWIIVGDGWMRSELEAMRARLGLESQVRFVGAADPVPYYAVADLFVLPSHYEGFGLVLLEAMVNRLPCIAFDSKSPEVITASREIIVHEKTGFVVEAKNSEEMAACIDRLFNDSDLCKEMGEQGYQRSVSQFTWENCVEGYLNISGYSLASDG
jgi:glycosyltransferase involved in cell wall biosynthesis